MPQRNLLRTQFPNLIDDLQIFKLCHHPTQLQAFQNRFNVGVFLELRHKFLKIKNTTALPTARSNLYNAGAYHDLSNSKFSFLVHTN